MTEELSDHGPADGEPPAPGPRARPGALVRLAVFLTLAILGGVGYLVWSALAPSEASSSVFPSELDLKTYRADPSDPPEIRQLKIDNNAFVEAFRRYQAASPAEKEAALGELRRAAERYEASLELASRRARELIREPERDDGGREP